MFEALSAKSGDALQEPKDAMSKMLKTMHTVYKGWTGPPQRLPTRVVPLERRGRRSRGPPGDGTCWKLALLLTVFLFLSACILQVIWWVIFPSSSSATVLSPLKDVAASKRAWGLDHRMVDKSPELAEIRSAVSDHRKKAGIEFNPTQYSQWASTQGTYDEKMVDAAMASVVEQSILDERLSRKAWAVSYAKWFLKLHKDEHMIMHGKFFYAGKTEKHMTMVEERRKKLNHEIFVFAGKRNNVFEIDFHAEKGSAKRDGHMLFDLRTTGFVISWGGHFFMEFSDEPVTASAVREEMRQHDEQDSSCQFTFEEEVKYRIVCHTRPFNDAIKSERMDGEEKWFDGFAFEYELDKDAHWVQEDAPEGDSEEEAQELEL